MDKFEKYLWDMDDKNNELYNECIEKCNNLDDSDVDEYNKVWNEYYKKSNDFINEIRDKTAEELSKRYNLSKKLCRIIANRNIGIDADNTLSADFLDAKRYARLARYVLDAHEKGEV